MRSIFFILCVSFFASCTAPHHLLHPRERVIEVRNTQGYVYGRGVLMDSGTLLTAKHVYDACDRSGECVLFLEDRVLTLRDHSLFRVKGDALWLSIRPISHINPIQILESPPLGSGLLVYRENNSLTGSIVALGVTAVGYDDRVFSGSVSTGAIETDIVLEVGQSGTPVWTLSGDLIGVMSSVDREKGRSWVVR